MKWLEERITAIVATLAVVVIGAWHIAGVGHRSGDYYWTLAVGRYMVAHETVLGHDVFSYGLQGHSIVSMEWGFDWMVGLSDRWGGSAGVSTLLIVIWLGAMAMVAKYLRSLGASRSRTVIIVTLAGVMTAGVVGQGRAMSLSLIYLPLLLWLLKRARVHRRWYLALGPLFALWMNTHGSALMGLGIVALEAAWTWVPAGRLARWENRAQDKIGTLAALGMSFVGCLATPWGPGMLVHDLGLSRGPVARSVPEWLGPDFHTTYAVLIAATIVLVLLRAVKHQRWGAFEMSTALALILGWCWASRFGPYTLLALGALFVNDPTPVLSKKGGQWLGLFGAGALVLVAANTAAAQPGQGHGMPTNGYAYLERARATGRVLSWYDWAGYGELQGWQSYVDGRLDTYPARTFKDYISLVTGSRDPSVILTSEKVRWVLWPSNMPLDYQLAETPGWRLAWAKDGVSLYERAGTTYADVNGRLGPRASNAG